MRKKRRELILFCSLLLASTPAYAENATEAVSISDTASDIGWTVDANEEVQSVSESDTPKTLASNEETFGRKLIPILPMHRIHMHFLSRLKNLEYRIS